MLLLLGACAKDDTAAWGTFEADEVTVAAQASGPVLRVAVWAVAFLLAAVVAFLATRLFNGTHHSTGWELVTETLKSDIFWKVPSSSPS